MRSLDDFDFLVISLFRAPVSEVRIAAERVIKDNFPAGSFEGSTGPLEIDSVYETCPPRGGAHNKRAVLFEPASARGTTALVANLEDGWVTMCNVLASAISGEHIRARSCTDVDYPLTEFGVWDDGVTVRYVRAFREDPSWEFYSRGEPRSFEDLGNYKKRRISDRLNREILVAYLRDLGWDLASPDFWTSKGPAFYLREKGR